MYRTGGTFKYNLKKPHIGSHRSHLGYMEDYVREVKRSDFERENKIYLLKNECEIMRNNLKEDYKNLKYEMNSQIDNLQMKFNSELGKQKLSNNKINKEMKELKKEMLDSQNLLTELKQRIDSLKLRIDGKEMYNEDGLPVLQTNIEY
jgi:chromosome segregation ATPase